MKNLERLIRCVYKDADFNNLCKQIVSADYMDGAAFDLKDEKTCQAVKDRYLRLFPNNYSEALLDNIINEKIGDKQHFFADEMFVKAAKKYLILKGEMLEINFDNLLEWNDFINVAPADIYIAAFPSKDLPLSFLTGHDNQRLYSILKEKRVAENHMHLNASGYSTELNWYSFVYKKPFYCKIKEFDDIFSLKLKMLRIYLEYHLKKESFLSRKDVMNILAAEDYVDVSRYMDDFRWMQHCLDEENKNGKLYSCERRFLKDCFLKTNDCLPLFRDLFNLYLTGFIQKFFVFAQDNTGMGFEKFQKCQDKKDLLFNDKGELYKSIAEKYNEENIVSKIEFRIAPQTKKKFKYIQSEMEASLTSVYGKNKPNCGYIFHFIKKKGKTLLHQISDISKQSRKILGLLNSAYSQYVVGIDAAGDELCVKPELYAPYFRRCRAEKADLSFTYHVGEVYTSLCSGLRAIYETIDFFNFRRGDRLGHALALGAEPRQLAQTRMECVVIPAGEYLDNLAWLFFMLRKQNADPLLSFEVSNRFTEIRNLIFQGQGEFCTVDISTYLASWRLRADDPLLYNRQGDAPNSVEVWRQNGENSAYREAFRNETARKLNWYYLYDKVYEKQRNQAVKIRVDETYLKVLSASQTFLKKLIANKGIAVEANPSSNRKISPIDNFADLPLFALNRHRLYSLAATDCDVPVCVNTDDSAVFQTSLGMEYAVIAKTLLDKGASSEEVYDFIEYLRKSSLEQSFVKEDNSLRYNQ